MELSVGEAHRSDQPDVVGGAAGEATAAAACCGSSRDPRRKSSDVSYVHGQDAKSAPKRKEVAVETVESSTEERCRKRAFDDRHTGRQDSRTEEEDAEEVANKEHRDLKSGGKEIAQRRWKIPDPGAAEEAVRLHCYRA